MSKKPSLAERLEAVQERSTLRLTTHGRKTSKPHTVTIWFLVDGEAVYLVTMRLGRDWPRNLIKNGYAELAVGGASFTGHAKQIKDAKRLARVNQLLCQKYWAAWLGSWLGFGPEGAFMVSIRE